MIVEFSLFPTFIVIKVCSSNFCATVPIFFFFICISDFPEDFNSFADSAGKSLSSFVPWHRMYLFIDRLFLYQCYILLKLKTHILPLSVLEVFP